MSQRVKDAKVEFYNPSSGALRYTLSDHLARINIEATATDQADDCGIDVKHDFTDLSNFVVGDECRVYIKLDTDGAFVHKWTGTVDSIMAQRHGPSFADLPIKAQGYVYWTLAHTYITDSWLNMTAGAIARDLMRNYVPTITATSATVEDTSTTVASFVSNGDSALTCLRRLAEYSNATFKGDKDKVLYFYVKATKASGYSVDTSKVVRDSFEVETSFSDFGNVVTVRGGKKKVQDSASTGGAFSAFASVTGIVRKKAQVAPSKSALTRVDIWTNPDTADTADNLAAPSTDGDLRSGSTTKRSESLTFTQAHILRAGSLIKLRLKKTGSPTGTATLYLTTDKDSALNTRVELTGTLDVSTLTTSYADYSFSFTTDYVFQAGTTYYIVLAYSGGDASNKVSWGITATNNFTTGTRWDYASPTWTETTGTDHVFRIEYVSCASGNLTVRIQANASGAPIAETDANYDIINASLPFYKLTAGGWTSVDLGAHVVPPGGTVWVIVESDANSQKVGLDAGSALMWRVYFDLPIIVQVSDATSISTYGQRFLAPVTNSAIATEDEATQAALRILAEHKDPIIAGSYEVDDIATLGQAPVGQTVSGTFTKDGVAAGTALIIQRQTTEYSADTGLCIIRHSFVNAARTYATEDIIRSMWDRIKKLEDAANATPVLYLVASTNDIAKVADSVSGTEATASTVANWIVGFTRVDFMKVV